MNNLTIEQMKEIVEDAPDGATHFVVSTYLKLIGACWWEAWLQEWNHDANDMVRRWRGQSIELMKNWGVVYKIEEIKDIIEKYHGMDDCCTNIENHISPLTKVINK